jgi:hypothetical protein
MVLSCRFALVQTRKSQKKRDKTVIFTILGVLCKKLQVEMLRCGSPVRGQPLLSEQDLGRGYGFPKKLTAWNMLPPRLDAEREPIHPGLPGNYSARD